MDEAPLVRGFEGIQHLARVHDCFVSWQRPSLQPRSQRLAVDELEDQIARRTGIGDLDAIDRADVRMIERRQHLGFALEAGDALRIGGDKLGERLDGDVTVEACIAGLVDLAHAARADCGHDLIRSDARAALRGMNGEFSAGSSQGSDLPE